MADIAFLLLIFFLVTTTLDVDTGIGMILPPPIDQTPPPQVLDRNMFRILVNAGGKLLVEDQPMRLEELRAEVKQHVMNCVAAYGYGCLTAYSEKPDKAVVSIKTTTETPYRVYIEVLDEVWMAYFEIWDEQARALGYTNYEAYRQALEEGQANVIREGIRPQISIAEPDQ